MKNWKSMFIVLAVAISSLAWADNRGGPRSLDECSASATFTLDSQTDDFIYDFENDAESAGHCGRRIGPDATFQLVVEETGLYSISLDYSGRGAWMYLTTGCCDGEQIFPRGLVESYSSIHCIWLEAGTYYLTVEGAGSMEMYINACNNPCNSLGLEDGITYDGTSITFVETVDANSTEPNYNGPWETDGPPCQQESANPDGDWVGFGYYNWYNQDFGWTHFFSTEGIECTDYTIDSACVIICAYENDYCGQGGPAAEASYCQWDEVYLDNSPYPTGILNPFTDPGSNLSVSETKIWVPTYQLEDGAVPVWVDIDAFSDQCAWATEVRSSKLVVYMTCRQIPPSPDGYDLGDLPSFTGEEQPCYPTNTPESGGPANAVFPAEDQVAWLGECVTHEQFPNTVDEDGCDDGVYFIPSSHSQGSWMPGEEVCVEVTISTGPGYQQGTPLYLWGWKDGNLDCDFDDFYEFPEHVASECIISGNEYFAPGPNSSFTVTVCFYDPGVTDMGRYDGHLRFRLLSAGGETPARNGDILNCTSAQTYVDDFLGETEDYIITDLQLPVELLSFTASSVNGNIVLNWVTATENGNDAFEVQRWSNNAWHRTGNLIDGAGTTASQRQYVYVDTDVTEGQSYRYRLVTIDVNGNRMPASEVERVVEPVNTTVNEFALHQNYPNPFNPTTEISYDLATASNVSLIVFDLLGREVATLVNGSQNAGRYTLNFDATGLPSGMYFYRLQTAEFSDMKKMMLLK
ncbi:MAG: T9SS type A sorting domain-containing protein [bacterium]|nr:T9SS type A sorting domain-containing protein [bacterium]